MALVIGDLLRDYGDAQAEAKACRDDCALFDFSFLERIRLEGAPARRIIESLSGRSVNDMGVGEIRYALRCHPDSTLAADLTIWRTGEAAFDVMSGRRVDAEDLLRAAAADCRVIDLTPQTAVFAVQGPGALDALRTFADVSRVATIPYFHFCQAIVAGVQCNVGRLGYTGEPGFEIILPRDQAPMMWAALASRMRRAGFAAVDQLRIEAGFPLYLHDFAVPVFPGEAGLAAFMAPCAAVGGPALRFVCFRGAGALDTLPWRPPTGTQRPVARGMIAITSACRNVSAGGVLGLGYVRADPDCRDTLTDPRGEFHGITLAPRPFYDTAKRKPRAAWR